MGTPVATPTRLPSAGFRTKARRVAAVGIATTALVLGVSAPASAAPGSLEECPLLLEGQTSECVRMLQAALNATGAPYNLAEDGSFGPGTRIALLDFQGRNHLPADGNGGPITLRELAGRSSSVATPQAGPTVAVTDKDVCAAQGLLPDGAGGCVSSGSGAAVAMGRPIGECVGEQAKSLLKSIANKKRGIAGKAIEAGKGGIKRFKAFYEVPKCILWDTPK